MVAVSRFMQAASFQAGVTALIVILAPCAHGILLVIHETTGWISKAFCEEGRRLQGIAMRVHLVHKCSSPFTLLSTCVGDEG